VNRYQRIIAMAWGAAGLTAMTAFVAWATIVPGLSPIDPLSTVQRAASHAALAPPIDTAGLAVSAARLRDRDPFRSERKPTSVRYNPWEPAPAPIVTPPRPPRPNLALVGIVGGPPWIALVEGVPGREGGVLLREGEEAGGVRLEAILGDTVRLAGLDTTWVLTPRRAWR
jgi:hypothetical protein